MNIVNMRIPNKPSNKRKKRKIAEASDFTEASLDLPIDQEVFGMEQPTKLEQSEVEKKPNKIKKQKRSKLSTCSEALDAYLSGYQNTVPVESKVTTPPPKTPSRSSSNIDFWPPEILQPATDDNLITSQSVCAQMNKKKGIKRTRVHTSPGALDYSIKKHYNTPTQSVNGRSQVIVPSTPFNFLKPSTIFQLSNTPNSKSITFTNLDNHTPISSDQVRKCISTIASNLSQVPIHSNYRRISNTSKQPSKKSSKKLIISDTMILYLLKLGE